MTLLVEIYMMLFNRDFTGTFGKIISNFSTYMKVLTLNVNVPQRSSFVLLNYRLKHKEGTRKFRVIKRERVVPRINNAFPKTFLDANTWG